MGALVAHLTWKAAGSLREGQRPRDTRDGHREGRRRPWTGKGTRERGAVSEPRRRLDEVTVATGWAGEAALRTCGPK